MQQRFTSEVLWESAKNWLILVPIQHFDGNAFLWKYLARDATHDPTNHCRACVLPRDGSILKVRARGDSPQRFLRNNGCTFLVLLLSVPDAQVPAPAASKAATAPSKPPKASAINGGMSSPVRRAPVTVPPLRKAPLTMVQSGT